MEINTTHEEVDLVNYPTNCVLGVVDNPGQAYSAIGDLNAAGFELVALAGAEGAERLDVTGEEHGLKGQIIRTIQKYGDSESTEFQRYDDELRAGHYVIRVHVDDENARNSVKDILVNHGGHFINYYGSLVTIGLEG
jgi:chitinase